MGVGGQRHTPADLRQERERLYSLYRSLSGPQDRFGLKILYLLFKKSLLYDHTKIDKRGGFWSTNNSVRII